METATTDNQQAAVQTPAVDPNATVVMVEQPFHFKTEKLRNEKGEEIGTGKKHPTVKIALPVPTQLKLMQWLSEPETYAKELKLISDTMLDQVYRVARTQINDWREANKDGTVTTASLNYDKLDWTAIANMPKGERASSIPSDEDIKAFLESYLAIMPAALNKSKDKIENHLLLFSTGFKKQRSQREILEAVVGFISVYMSAAGEETVAEHEEVLDYFSAKLERMLKVEEKITLDSL